MQTSTPNPRSHAAVRAAPDGAVGPLALVIDGGRTSQAPQPITVGVPFPRGMLMDPGTAVLFDEEGHEAILQTLSLARWSDGSMKWLLMDFILPGIREGNSRWTLRTIAESNGRPAGDTLRVVEAPSAVTIDSGPAAFQVGRTAPGPLLQVTRAGKELAEPRPVRLVFTDAEGLSSGAEVRQVALEEQGPVRTTVRLDGVFVGRAPRWTARVCFFAGTGLVRVRLTVHNPDRAKHPGGLWDLGDPGSMFFRDLALEVALPGPAVPRLTWTAEAGRPPRSAAASRWEVYQDSSGGENWRSKNHVNRHGQVPCSFRGYRVRIGEHEEFGLRASPTVAVQGPFGSVTATIPEFWQQFPKAIRLEDNVLRLQFFPGQFADLFELQGGEQKTHTVWLHCGPDGPAPLAPLAFVHRPARARATPEWYARSGAVPHLLPATSVSDERLEALLAEAVTGENRFVARREVIDEYGWRHYGEMYADHETEYYRGPLPVVSHYNNQYDVVFGTLLQYLRTGDGRWLEVLDPLARHVIDIDIYHTDRDKPAYNGGLFWFTDHYKDAGTCTHRTYSRVNCRPGDRSYGGGPSSNHCYSTGLLHYYFLTGDPAARDAVVRLADWTVNMDDGTKNPLGLIDPGDTGIASHTAVLEYQGPGRGAGNAVNALLDGWTATGRRAYLDKAERLIRRTVHPDDDIPARDLLNAEKRWSYTMYLTTLARYLDVKADAGEVDFMYAYAQTGLVNYARWMLEHERPYYDHPEQLEYPTETWAAHDLRKANVLRLAAAHADEPLRVRLCRRGEELAERAWKDYLRFASRAVTRGLAIVMTEGPRDTCLRARPPGPAPRPAQEHDFGRPEVFVPQKLRVFAQLKTVRGLVRALARVANPWNWRALAAFRKSLG